VPFSGSGGRVFAVGRGEWRSSQAGGAGAGGELIDLDLAMNYDQPDVAATAPALQRNLSPTRAMSLAQAIRDGSRERGLSHESPVAFPPAA